MRRPRALLIAPMHPSRTGNGLAMRIALFVEAIETFADLDVRILPVAGWPIGDRHTFGDTTQIEILDLPYSTIFDSLLRISPDEARLAALRRYGLPRLSSFLSDAVKGQIGRNSDGYDLVHVVRSYMLPVVDVIDSPARLSIDLDEDDFENFSSQAASVSADHAFASDLLTFEATALDRLVDRYARRADLVFASSEREKQSLERRHPDVEVHVVPNAVGVPAPDDRCDNGRTIVFVGSFGYGPNVEGVTWFLSEVLPHLIDILPESPEIILAGSNPPPTIVALEALRGVKVIGDFPDASDIYRHATICIAPMRAGGGLRTKILEAGAYGVACIVHSSCAIEPPGPPIGWTAGDATEFAEACAMALIDSAERRRRGQAARDYVGRHFERTAVIQALAKTLREAATT